VVTGCTDDEILSGTEIVDETVSPLQFSVKTFTVASGHGSRSAEPSNYQEPETEDERKIENFWLFQFKPDGSQLAAPMYYSLAAGQTLNQLTAQAYADLTPNTLMTIYVVANIGSQWTEASNLNTLQKVKNAKLPNPYPIRVFADKTRSDELLIPMSGQVDNVKKVNKSLIIVPVTRIYAKIKINVNFVVEGMVIYDGTVENIPFYATISPNESKDAIGEPAAVAIPTGTDMQTRSFSDEDVVTDANGDRWLVIYVPENRQGEIDGADKSPANPLNIPEQALNVYIRAKYNGSDFVYRVYPGENPKNNFNIRRNCVYRIMVDVKSTKDQHNPSSNCYVVKPHSKVTFEPYNRVETGGDYHIEDYLNPDDASKKIDKLEIIWQTKDCIGDNTDGNLVTFTLDEQNPRNSKVTVYTGEEGNALVGARNKQTGEIVWSWHIWVTENEPDNFREAIVYKTYAWDSSGIKGGKKANRIPGYGVMQCNLGALAYRAGDMSSYSIAAKTAYPLEQQKTFGMLYQWGRKDPFPPMICSTGKEELNGYLEYIDDYTDIHYANDNTTQVYKTSGFTNRRSIKVGEQWGWPIYETVTCLFYSALGRDLTNAVKYGIAHPTVYIAGTQMASTSNETYFNGGDWCPQGQSDDRLWGAEEKTGSYLSIDNGKARLYNNYGTKSIFDPCPMGWRVAPPDLWLGFSETGLNPTSYDQVNFCENETQHRPGMSMYVREWGGGPTVYFPLQGTRQYNGKLGNVGLCGNYHNATCDAGNRVNILHLHRNMSVTTDGQMSMMLFKIFEYDNQKYYVKSTAGPIRCVRDSK